MTDVPTITCKLSPELDARLTATARARRTTKSTIVRELLEAKLIDPERGLYSISLVPTDDDTLQAWAQQTTSLKAQCPTGPTL